MTLDHLDLSRYPSMNRLVEVQLEVWPAHVTTLQKSFVVRSDEALRASEEASAIVITLSESHMGDLRGVCADYRFVCEEMILKEEWYFRRRHRYRLSSFAEAQREYYSKPDLMTRYMNGLLLSEVFWVNHANALNFYLKRFLPGNQPGYSHLEVGPGHGLLLCFAARDPRSVSISGWDVSAGSLAATARALEAAGVRERVQPINRSVFHAAPGAERFDSIVVSEVLEHLEDPRAALENLLQCLRPGGRILANTPSNSPAPDHLYLLREPEEMLDLMKAVGFEIEQYALFPMIGRTLDECRLNHLTINCCAIGRRPK